MLLALILTAFILGLGSSLHCLGMCGPLILAMPFESKNHFHTQWRMVTYFISKAIMYGLLGWLFGLFGWGIKSLAGQNLLSILSGALILAMILKPIRMEKFQWVSGFNRLTSTWFDKLLKDPKWTNFVFWGMFNALLPCMMVFAAIGGSLSTANAQQGFVFMFAFGIGTAPLLVLAYSFKTLIHRKYRLRLQWSSKVMTILLAIILILRGMPWHLPHPDHPALNKASKMILCKVPE